MDTLSKKGTLYEKILTLSILTASALSCSLSFADDQDAKFYNPVISNYNIKYDSYPMSRRDVQEDQQVAGPVDSKSAQIAQLQEQIAQLKQQRNENTKNFMNGSLGNMMSSAAHGNQLNTDIQNLEDRLTTLMTGQAPIRVVNQSASRRPLNCYTYGLGNAFTTCN